MWKFHTAEEAEYGFTFDVEGSAAKDPEWRAKISAEYNDCHEMAQSWPATSLNRSPMSRMFGRQMLFFKCADVSNTLSYLYHCHLLFCCR